MLRAAIRTLEPDAVFTEDAPAAEVVEVAMAPTRLGAVPVGGFGVLVLALASVGPYGVIAYSVQLRRREVGLRLAMGPRPGQVLWLILAQKGRLALAGIATGAAAGASVARLSWREVLPETGRGAPAGARGPRRAPSASGVPTGRPLENHSARPGAGVGAAPTAPRSRSPTVRTTT
jgi:hypothetical protein